MASEIDAPLERRLHPLSWVFALIGFGRQFVIPLAAVVFFGARDDGSLWGLLFIIPLLVAAWWRQMSFRYGFGSHSLVISEGLLFRNVRQIDYSRIENIDTERSPLQRLLGVAEVRLESSTGGQAEGLIRVLSLDAVQELRDRVFSGVPRGSVSDELVETDRPAPLLHLSTGELIRYGLIDNRGLLIVAAAVGLVMQTNVVDISRDSAEQWFGMLLGEWLHAGTMFIVSGAIGIVLFIVFTRLLSVVWALVTLHDFTLTRQADDLRVQHGLLTRVALTLRVPRIQAVHQTQSVLHRLFDRVSLSVDLAGDDRNSDEKDHGERKTRVKWLAPLCTGQQATEIICVALPMSAVAEQPEWQPLSTRARSRIFRKSLLASLIVCSLPALIWSQYWLLATLVFLIPVAWWHATAYTKHTSWALTSSTLLFRSGWLTRRLSIVPRDRVQVVQSTASPFDARKRMAAVIVDTAGASGLLKIPYLDAATARGLAQALYRGDADVSHHQQLNWR